jgi:quaternary ammonium compound-resistance protein SugE
MSWIVLIISGLFEGVWAVALTDSPGSSPPWFSLRVAFGAWTDWPGQCRRSSGTAYAVWVGTGARLAVAYGTVFGGETFSVIKVLLMIGLVGYIVGLMAVS